MHYQLHHMSYQTIQSEFLELLVLIQISILIFVQVRPIRCDKCKIWMRLGTFWITLIFYKRNNFVHRIKYNFPDSSHSLNTNIQCWMKKKRQWKNWTIFFIIPTNFNKTSMALIHIKSDCFQSSLSCSKK